MAPKSTAAKVAAVCYVLACGAVGAYAVAARDIRDTDIIVAYAMLFLSFPAGYAVAALFAGVAYSMYEGFGIIVPGGLGNNIVAVLLFGGAGYVQWFVALPWAIGKRRAPSNNALEADRDA